jgi:hypothetical protein
MPTDAELDQLSRDELVARARALGARRPEVMTRVELRDEIVRLSETDPQARRRSRGWLGVARDLVASVVDNGLNLPGAAAAIRGEAKAEAAEWQGPPPVATLTLAEIYLAQGHYDRALAVVDEVLANEPDHASGLALRARIETDRNGPHARRRPAGLVSEPPPTPIPPPPAPAPIEPPRPHPAGPSEEQEIAQTPPSEPTAAPAPDVAIEASPLPTTLSFGDQSPVDPAAETPPSGAVAATAPQAVADCSVLVTASSLEALVSLTPFQANSVLRIVWVVPNVAGSERGELDVQIEPERSRFSLPAAPPKAFVRAALGTLVGSEFQPLAVAWVYRALESGLEVAFAAPGAEPLQFRSQLEVLAAARVG